jgi:hypothetical protein
MRQASKRVPDSAEKTARLACRYRGLMRADAGWPGTLKRLPVSVIVVPLTRRIEKS